MRRRRATAMLWLLPLVLIGCGRTGTDRSAAADPMDSAVVDFVDAEGIRHAWDGPATRIVSLVPSATETLRAIGAEDRLVGRTDFDAAWTTPLPSVGGGLEPSLEAVVALDPDVVIRFGGEQDTRTPARLDELGIRHVAVRPVRLDDVYETNRIIGAITGRTAQAEALTREIRDGLTALAGAEERRPVVRVVYMLGGSPPWVAGPDTYISEILTLLGGENVFGDLDRPYAPISPEELRARPIDVVLLSGERTFDPSLVPEARVERIGEELEIPGPDVVRAARMIAAAMHGEPIG